MTYFLFKERVEDFIVEELLEKEPEGTGDFHYVFFEKKGLATFDVIRKIQDEFGLNRNMIGIAGLKDKQGVTRQWLSFPKRDVHKLCGGVNNLLNFLRKMGKVVTATYGHHALKLGVNKGNKFAIMLRPLQKRVSDDAKTRIDTILTEIQQSGLPNYFGEQRFGHRGNNRKTGEKLVSGEIHSLKGDNNTMVEKRFKVQAYASYLFNRYLDIRAKQRLLNTLVPGDVIVPADGRPKFWTGEQKVNTDKLNITGPVFGFDLTYAKDKAATLEKEMMDRYEIDKSDERAFNKFQLFGIRRPIMIYPEGMTRKWTKDFNLMLSFDLPSGAYASVVVDWMEQRLTSR